MAVAHRMYARALFDAAKEQGRLNGVRTELADFVSAANDVPELRELLRNPQLDPRAKVSMVEELLGETDELVRNFLILVVQKGRGGELDGIQREFERLVAQEERRLTVALTTAYELSDDEAAGIVAQIERAAGRRVEATRSVDPELIGGLVLQAGSLRVDASVRGRLDRLRQELVTRR